MSLTKTCLDCRLDLPAGASSFSKKKRSADGLMSYCKACMSVRWKRHYADRREHHVARAVAQVKKRRIENPEYDRGLAREKKRRDHKDPEKYAAHLERGRIWFRENAERVRAMPSRDRAILNTYAANRRGRELQQTPPWVSISDILPFYQEAARLTAETGTPHEVDHVIPLAGKGLCGLHVPWNLEVIPRAINRRKSARIDVHRALAKDDALAPSPT
ncbi:hypothetical protein [Methylobacterium mesophilicum]